MLSRPQALSVVLDEAENKEENIKISGFHVMSPNSRIQNREAYKIFTFIQEKIT